MVVYKNTECVNVFELRAFFVIPITNLVHALLATKYVLDCVVHGVVEKTSEILRVGANISGVSVEAFTHLENSSTFSILPPEVLGDLRNGIDSNSIKVKFRNDAFDPVFEVVSNVIVGLIQVGESSKSAVLNTILVIPVDVTIVVVMFRLVKWVNLAEVKA